MIRINLLPTKATVRVTTGRTQLIIGGVLILVSLIGTFIWANSLSEKIGELETKIKKEQVELKKVEAARKKLESIKKLNEQRKKKLEVIQKIEQSRTGPVWLMDQLADAAVRFPIKNHKTGKITWRYKDDKVFLKKMTVKGSKLELNGIAINNTYLVAFLNNLKSKSDVFRSVKLIVSKSVVFDKAKVRNFSVTCNLNLSSPPRIGGPTTVAIQKKKSPSETGSGSESKNTDATGTK